MSWLAKKALLYTVVIRLLLLWIYFTYILRSIRGVIYTVFIYDGASGTDVPHQVSALRYTHIFKYHIMYMYLPFTPYLYRRPGPGRTFLQDTAHPCATTIFKRMSKPHHFRQTQTQQDRPYCHHHHRHHQSHRTVGRGCTFWAKRFLTGDELTTNV